MVAIPKYSISVAKRADTESVLEISRAYAKLQIVAEVMRKVRDLAPVTSRCRYPTTARIAEKIPEIIKGIIRGVNWKVILGLLENRRWEYVCYRDDNFSGFKLCLILRGWSLSGNGHPESLAFTVRARLSLPEIFRDLFETIADLNLLRALLLAFPALLTERCMRGGSERPAGCHEIVGLCLFE